MKKITVVLALIAAMIVMGQSYKQDETFVKNMTPQTYWYIQRTGVASTITTFASMIKSTAAYDTAWSRVYWKTPSESFHAFVSNAQDSSHYEVSLWTSNAWNSRFMRAGILSWSNENGYRLSQTLIDSVGSWRAVSDDLYPPGHRYFRLLVRVKTGHHVCANTDYIEITVLGRNEE